MEGLRNTPIHCIAALLMLNKGRYLHYAFARETMPRKRLTQESVRKLNPVPANRSVFSMLECPALFWDSIREVRRPGRPCSTYPASRDTRSSAGTPFFHSHRRVTRRA